MDIRKLRPYWKNSRKNDERIFPVMDNSSFIGVVNLNHIIEYLLLHKADTIEYNRLRSLVGLLH